jgi:hypothetical protein
VPTHTEIKAAVCVQDRAVVKGKRRSDGKEDVRSSKDSKSDGQDYFLTPKSHIIYVEE